MSYAKLSREEEQIRVNLTVNLSFEDVSKALIMADKLDKLSGEVSEELSGCYAWASELAALIRNK